MTEICVAPAKLAAVGEAVAALDEVRWIGLVSGHFDLLIEGMFRSEEHLRDFLIAKLGRIDGITRMRTVHVLKVPKIAFNWEQMRHASEEVE